MGMLDGKIVLVTGGGGGVGRSTAIRLASEGATVVVADVSQLTADETANLIRRQNGQALAIQADVTVDGQVRRMVDAAIEKYGRLDCAFNNAGVSGPQIGVSGLKTGQWTEEAFDQIVDVNLKGVWLCMRAELECMVAQASGVIVNASSIGGLVGLATSSAYVASKHAVIGLTRSAALEYAQAGIRVNAIAPGYVETEMTREIMQQRGSEILAKVPMGRMALPEEIADLVCWLCSDRSSFVTGSVYIADGGYLSA